MIVIIEDSPILARCFQALLKRESTILPGGKIRCMDMTLKYLKKNNDRMSHILINANMSFREGGDPVAFEGVMLLREILVDKIFDNVIKILYSINSLRMLKAHGAGMMFDEDYSEVFEFVRLPGVFPKLSREKPIKGGRRWL